MSITDDQLADATTAVARSRRIVRLAAATLALGWLAMVVCLLVLAARESSYDRLEAGIRSGDITQVHAHGTDYTGDLTGWETASVTWRDDLVLRTATITHASDEQAARDARRNDAPLPVVVGSLADHLATLDPDLAVTAAGPRYPSSTILGWQASGWFVPAYAVLLIGTLGLIAGPRPWRATRWAWAWLVLLAPVVGIPAYFLLGGPLGLFRPREPHRVTLTGGWAFLLALLLGGSSAA
ncbi:PLD nuclease N-terminal domain-containing protein [Nocardioides currus]|uniref:Uncharacterized protein n=1 Tax=Nocardioides currus TaxID=2133958 RepID=A0A2R7Z3K0_9ACTN|nr:PLD nuclease N-terminal domain-containing protein [Nocardioides currus]PUA82819.1 hypothetical protein C7S10_03660 [Nocardioides currus]